MNPYAIPPLITSILALFLGVLTFRSVNPKVRYTFPLVSITVFIWLFGYFLAYSATEYEVAFKWIRLLYIGVIFIPAVSYHFTAAFLDLKGKTKFIALNYLIAAGFAILSRSEAFIAGAYKYFWGYQTKVGPLHNIFLVFFFVVMVRVILLLLSQYRNKKKEFLPLQSNRIKYVLISFFASIFAASDFLPNYGIEFYPLGFICISFYAIMTTYAIVRYKVMDVNVILTRAGVFVCVYTLILGIPFVIGNILQSSLSELFSYWWIFAVLIGIILASIGPFIYMKLQKRVEARLRAEEFKSHEALRRLSHNMLRFTNLEALLKLIVHYLVKILKLKFSAVYLYDNQSDKYILKSFWQINGEAMPPAEFFKKNLLVKDFYLRRLPIVTEELRLSMPKIFFSHIKGLLATLTNLNANTVIPSFLHNELLGFLVLSDRRTNLAFTQEDLNLLMVLSNEAALAIENAQLHEREKMGLIEKSRQEALADMAPGASHQFNNRLVAISSSAELALLRLENFKVGAIQDEKLKELLSDIKKSLETIENEALKGKDITSAILKRAKAKIEFQEIDIKQLIENAYKLVAISRSKSGFSEPKFNIVVSGNIPMKILGSEALLQDVFYNIIDNSVDAIMERARLISEGRLNIDFKYQGKIEGTLRQEGEVLTIEMKDNGIGITKEAMRKLFTPYFTTKATSGKGSGLGLYVIREFVEKHGGTIACESEYEKGTTFMIKLPIRK